MKTFDEIQAEKREIQERAGRKCCCTPDYTRSNFGVRPRCEICRRVGYSISADVSAAFGQLRAQRDDLLAACKAVERLKGKSITDAHGDHSTAFEEVMSLVTQAIARAEGRGE